MPEDREGVTAAQRAFYAALEARDAQAMGRVWERSEEAACIHPGWHRLDGWAEIERSWRTIFENSRPWSVRAEEERLAVAGDLAVVFCTEVIEPRGGSGAPARMTATNLFRRGPDGWKMLHHHASAMPELEAEGELPVN